jgi:KDO2-lipid IV(A) lauroyltransferase
MTYKATHIVEYVFFLLLGSIVRLIPLSYVHKVGFALARFFYPFLGSRRRVAMQNLRNAFPEKNESELNQIAFRSFQNISATFVDLLWMQNLTKEMILDRVHIENPELLKQLLEKKKGIIFLSAHFGSWELATQAIAVYAAAPMCAIAKQQSNILVDRLINRWRELFGVKVVFMGISVREILRTIQNGGMVTLVADQSAPKESIPVEFFGRLVPTFEGPAVFCLKTGAPIILGCTVRQKDGNYTMRLMQVPSDDLTDASDANILELTQRQVRMTEDIIRQYPDQWMWMHKRWKHVPDRVEVDR